MDDELIELGLLKTDGESKRKVSSKMALLAEGLLGLLSTQVVDGEMPDAEKFRERLRSYRDHIIETDTIDNTSAKNCLEDCETQFRCSQSYLEERDTGISDMIALLRETLQQLVGDTKLFDERIFDSSDRFKRLSALEDIRELRKQITTEVRQLRETMLEKQQSEEQTYAKFAKRIEFLHSKLKLARELSLIDPLTQIANHGGFVRAVGRLIKLKRPFILAMMDVDHFKAINDTHGHPVGDAVIVCAAKWINEQLRGTDLVARYGGDEFGVLIPGMSLERAELRFAAMLRELAGRSYEYLNGTEKRIVKFTISCGLSEFGSGDKPLDLIQRADEALYVAKKQRNHVSIKRKSLLDGLFPKRSRTK